MVFIMNRKETSFAVSADGNQAMKITDPSLHFDLLSVIELHLPAQNCIIAPRQYSTLSFRL